MRRVSVGSNKRNANVSSKSCMQGEWCKCLYILVNYCCLCACIYGVRARVVYSA